MTKNLMMVGLAASILVACGGNSFSGSVKGSALNPQDAIFETLNSTTSNSQALLVLVSDQPNLCEKVKANQLLKNATKLTFILGVTDSQGHGQPLVTGTYNVTSVASDATGNLALVGFDKSDASCHSTFGDNAPAGTTGTVMLSSFDAKVGGVAHGNFDVKFDADHVTGVFNATYCDVPSDSGTATCD